MRHKRVFAVASAAIAAAAVLFATPAGAQELLPITVDPTSGPAGTAVAVSGADCLTEDPGLAPEVEIFFGDDSGGVLAGRSSSYRKPTAPGRARSRFPTSTRM